MSVNILDGFAGIGGFSLAIQRAGFEIKNHYASEVDKYAQWIYRKQFPESVQLGDVTGINGRHGKIDIITAGFPCQSFSIAGKRRGFEDTRGTLFFDIERLARIYKPSYMVLENVKGLFSHDGGNTIRIILDKLRRLNYSIQLLLLNTVDFGIPQNRERCFFICTLAGKRQPEISHIREAKRETAFSSNAIDANYWKGIDNHGQRTCIAQAVCTPEITVKGQNGRIIKDPEDPMFTLTARDKHGVLISDSGQGRKREVRDIAPPLRSHNGCGHDNYTFKDTIIRRLTPVECARLQDYPDNWAKYGINESGEQVMISDTQQYKVFGNSITVKPAELIMRAIKEVL